MATSERMQILKMIEEGKISATEGAKLLAAMETAHKKESQHHVVGTPGKPRWFRVRVTDLNTGRAKVNVNIPMSLVNVGIKMGARFAPEVEGVELDEVMEQIKSGAQGKIIDVEDAEDGERVEIYVE
jgi:hypothetical protein